MKILPRIFTSLLLGCAISNAAFAAAPGGNLGTCLQDSMNGKDRKEFAKFVFVAMAAHPDMKKYSNVTAEDRVETSKSVAQLITRLLTVDCAAQVRETMQGNNSAAFSAAFEQVGKAAMQELMTNAEVTETMGGIQQYLDKEKFKELYRGK